MIFNHNPLVSIIIPTFNCGNYIEAAIESVLSQEYEPVEIIVIDDGSTDDTVMKLKRYGDKIKYLYQENRGSSRARNVGLSSSCGEFIAYLDADDIWLPGKLSLQVKLMKELPEVGLVFSDFSAIDENGRFVKERYIEDTFFIFKEYGVTIKEIFHNYIDIHMDYSGERGNNSFKIYHGNVLFELFKGNFILPSTTLFRRALIDRIGLIWNEEYKCAQDQDYNLRFAKHFPVAFMDSVTAGYRIKREGKLSGNKNVPILIKNTIYTLERLVKDDRNLFSKKGKLVREVFGKTYLRLAYYYLSENQRAEARKSALCSLKREPLNPRTLGVLFLTYLPEPFLRALARVKSWLKKEKN